MKSRCVFFAALLLGSFSTVATAQQSRTLYFDAAGKVTSQSSASFYSTITRDSKDTTLFNVSSFFKGGSPRQNGGYKAQRYPVRWELLHQFGFMDAFPNGKQKEYFENGQVLFEGVFTNGLGNGLHLRYYETGQLL
jgi:hypothetical protein